MARTMVVFPTPGPPVTTRSGQRAAFSTARRCSSASSVFVSRSNRATASAKPGSAGHSDVASRASRAARRASVSGLVDERAAERVEARALEGLGPLGHHVAGPRDRDERVVEARERVGARRLDLARVRCEEASGSARQVLRDHEAVALLDRVAERLEQRSLHPLGRVLRDADRRGDPVGRTKPDPPDVDREPVGIARDDRDRLRPVALEDPRRELPARAVRLQEHHDVADGALLLPRADDGVRPRAPEACDLAQPLGVLVQHAQRVEPEARDDALRGDAADPLDEPGAEVLLDARERARGELGHARRAELLAVVPIHLEDATRSDARPDGHARERADDREPVLAPGHRDLDDAEAGLGVLERHALDLAFDRDLDVLRHGGRPYSVHGPTRTHKRAEARRKIRRASFSRRSRAGRATARPRSHWSRSVLTFRMNGPVTDDE
jgi:hypothetical protein